MLFIEGWCKTDAKSCLVVGERRKGGCRPGLQKTLYDDGGLVEKEGRSSGQQFDGANQLLNTRRVGLTRRTRRSLRQNRRSSQGLHSGNLI